MQDSNWSKRMDVLQPTLANGRYRIEGRLGEGGMAAVFRAYDTRLHVERAIKILSPDLSRHTQIRDRFETEASTMARLHHRNIVTVHDIGSDGPRVFMVMEMVRGGSLMDRIEDHGVLHPQLAIDATIAMAEALGVAHKHKIVHRDVKPHNVLISRDGVAKMTDFGIARIEDGASSGKTKTGAVMGTMSYMAPEQRLSARRATAKSDLYAVAASFYVMLTMGNPFDIFDEEMHDELFDGLQAEIVEFLKKGCHLSPAQRFEDSEDMVRALEELRQHLPAKPEGILPLYVLHEGADSQREMTEEQVSKLHTLWENYGGMTHSAHSVNTNNSENASNTVGFDLWDDEEEGFDPFAIVDQEPGNDSQVDGTIAPPMNESDIQEQSVPPQPQNPSNPGPQTNPQATILPQMPPGPQHPMHATQPYVVAQPPQKTVNPILWFLLILVVGGGVFAAVKYTSKDQTKELELQAELEKQKAATEQAKADRVKAEADKVKLETQAQKDAKAAEEDKVDAVAKAEADAKAKAEVAAKAKADAAAKAKAEAAAKATKENEKKTTSNKKTTKTPPKPVETGTGTIVVKSKPSANNQYQ